MVPFRCAGCNSYVGGYQGAPISHLMDVLSDAQGLLKALGVHFEASASRAALVIIGEDYGEGSSIMQERSR